MSQFTTDLNATAQAYTGNKPDADDFKSGANWARSWMLQNSTEVADLYIVLQNCLAAMVLDSELRTQAERAIVNFLEAQNED